MFRLASLIGLTALACASTAGAQALSVEPSQAPSAPRIALTATVFHDNPREGGFTFMLALKSLTGAPVTIATTGAHDGWSAFTSAGVVCDNFHITTPNVPHIYNSAGDLDGPIGLTVGVQTPALVPVTVRCPVHLDDEVSVNIVLFVSDRGRWVAQNFAIQRQRLQ